MLIEIKKRFKKKFYFLIMSTNFYEEIIDNYKKLYKTKEGYDAKIYVGE